MVVVVPEFLAQAILYGLCLAAVCLLAFRGRRPDRAISLILSLMWAAMAVAFFNGFRQEPVTGWLVAALFLLQALVLGWDGALRDRLDFRPRTGALPVVGALFLIY